MSRNFFHPFRAPDTSTAPKIRYEVRFHRTPANAPLSGGVFPENARAWTWHVRKITPFAQHNSVTNFAPGFAQSYKAARDAATEFIEHQRLLDETPWEEL